MLHGKELLLIGLLLVAATGESRITKRSVMSDEHFKWWMRHVLPLYGRIYHRTMGYSGKQAHQGASSATTITPTPATTTTTPEPTTPEPEVTENATDLIQTCSQLMTQELRDVCERVSSNPVLKSMSGVRGSITENGGALPDFLITKGFSFIREENGKQIICDEPTFCPDYTLEEPGTEKNRRSLSPWIMCQEYDPNRFPQLVNTASCLCKGCINSRSGLEDIGDVVSETLTVDISVLRKDALTRSFRECTRKICREVVEKVAIGCHCAITNNVFDGR